MKKRWLIPMVLSASLQAEEILETPTVQEHSEQSLAEEGAHESLNVEIVDFKSKADFIMDATTITASEEEMLRITGSAHLIDEEELATFKYDDIHRALSQVPGVYIREEDGYGLRPNIGFRGADSNRSKKVVLMEDGILFGPAPYSAPAAYYFPLTSRMTGIEVFKGPSSIQHGPNTIGGAINLQTREVPLDAEGAVDVSYGSDQYMKGAIHYGETKGQWGYLLDMTHLRSDGFKDLDNGADTGFEKTEVMLKLQWESDLDAKYYQRSTFKLGYSEEESNETYLGLSDADFGANPNRRYSISQDDLMDWDRHQFQWSHFIALSDRFELNTRAYHHDFTRNWSKMNSFSDGTKFLDVLNGTANSAQDYLNVINGTVDSAVRAPHLLYGSNARDYVSQGLQFDSAWTLESSIPQVLKMGLRYHRDEIERNHDEGVYQTVSGDVRPIAGTTAVTTVDHDQTKAISAYVLDEIEFEQWKVSPGIRLEHMDMSSNNKLTGVSSDRKDTVVLLGVGANYAYDEHWSILGGIHQGFSPVSPGQALSVEKEDSINYEFGARYHKDHLKVEGIAFFNDYSNLLGEATLSTGASSNTIGTQYNGGEVDVFGFELTAENAYDHGEHHFPVKASYTYTNSEFKSTFGSTHYGYDRDPNDGVTDQVVLAGEELPYVPEHMLQINLGWHVQEWRTHLKGKYQSKMKEIASAEETDAYWNFDLATHYDWDEDKTVYAKVDNLLDEDHIASRRPYGARPGKPRQWFLGFEYRL
jgi:Fe(3+) dicitrate transport protein